MTDDAAGIIILGVDPGLRITGYGVLRLERADVHLVTCGVIRPKGETPERLADIYNGLWRIAGEHAPAEMSIEQPFVALNTRSAFAIGEARAAAILAAAHTGMAVHQYAPTAVKQAVTGYGGGSKDQVAEMVRLQFGLVAAPKPADAADAVAIALCHVAHRRTRALIGHRR